MLAEYVHKAACQLQSTDSLGVKRCVAIICLWVFTRTCSASEQGHEVLDLHLVVVLQLSWAGLVAG